MVAAEVPGSVHADWAEDLIALAFLPNFTYDFTITRGLSRPPPKATHSSHSLTQAALRLALIQCFRAQRAAREGERRGCHGRSSSRDQHPPQLHFDFAFRRCFAPMLSGVAPRLPVLLPARSKRAPDACLHRTRRSHPLSALRRDCLAPSLRRHLHAVAGQRSRTRERLPRLPPNRRAAAAPRGKAPNAEGRRLSSPNLFIEGIKHPVSRPTPPASQSCTCFRRTQPQQRVSAPGAPARRHKSRPELLRTRALRARGGRRGICGRRGQRQRR